MSLSYAPRVLLIAPQFFGYEQEIAQGLTRSGHDVDMLPENEQNIYNCDRNFPKQMAIAVNINSYS